MSNYESNDSNKRTYFKIWKCISTERAERLDAVASGSRMWGGGQEATGLQC